MERRPHPGYFRKVAGFSFGLFGVSLGCLVTGFALERAGLNLISDVLYFAFAAGFIVAMVAWFTAGESTTCPECGRRLRSEPGPEDDEKLLFICRDCGIEWESGDVRET